MKKLVSLVLALALALSLCAMPASAEEATEVIFWLSGNAGQKDEAVVVDYMNEILAEAGTGVKVNFVIVQGGEWVDRFNRALAAGERIDMSWMGWHHNIEREAVDGNILPVDEYLNEYGQGIIEALGTETIDNHRQKDGLLYQIPSWQGMVHCRAGIWFPTQTLGEAGLDQTWVDETQNTMYEFWAAPTLEKQQAIFDAFDVFFGGLVESGNIRKGMGAETFTYNSIHMGGPVWGAGTFNKGMQYGYISMYDDTFTVQATVDSEYRKNFYKNMAEFYDKGYIREDIASAKSQATILDGLDDQDGITASHNAWVDNHAERITESNGLPMTNLFQSPFNHFELGRATGVVIPYTSEQPEAAMKFLNEMYANQDLYIAFCFGIEGQHYDVKEDGSLYLYGDGQTEASGATQANSSWTYGQTCWYIGTCANLIKTQNPTHDPEYYQELKNQEATAYNVPFLTFNFDQSNVETEVAALDALRLEMDDPLCKGYLGVDGWEAQYNAYRDAQYANGLETVIAEYQAQVNEFVEAKGITAWNYPDVLAIAAEKAAK